jgi:hypothetical protein
MAGRFYRYWATAREPKDECQNPSQQIPHRVATVVATTVDILRLRLASSRVKKVPELLLGSTYDHVNEPGVTGSRCSPLTRSGNTSYIRSDYSLPIY